MIDWSTHMAEEAAGVNDTTNPEWCDQCYADPCDCDRRFDAWHDREYDDWGQAA